MVGSGVVTGKAHSFVQNPIGLYAAGYGLSPHRGSIHEPGRLRTTVGRTGSGNRSAQRRYPRAPIVNIGTILDVAHLIPEPDRRWLVNSRINLRTVNEIY